MAENNHYRRKQIMKKEYEKTEMEVIVFEEDVLTSSTCPNETPIVIDD